nr:hypothetical protein [Mycoplasmopsis bovis]
MIFKKMPKQTADLYSLFQKKVIKNKDKIKNIPVVSEGLGESNSKMS